jgi:peptidoglycan/xylan/chitin deacetylase (PgdA/CDA1 family)
MDTSSSDDDGESAASSNFRILFAIFLSFFFLLISLGNKTHSSKKFFVEKRTQPVVEQFLVMPADAKKPKKKKKIYLTFDDGPNRGTMNVLNILKQENVPATFFIVGEHVFMSKDQAATWDSLLHAKNIELCNHSYTHANNHYNKFYKDPGKVVKDVELTKEKLLPDNEIVRAPGRNAWRIDSLHYTDIKKSKAAIDSLQAAGFIVMGWDLEWHYNPKTLVLKTSADELLKQVDSLFAKKKTKVADNLVLLAHDQVYKSKVDSIQLRELVQKLKKSDEYELSVVSSYPAIRNDSLKTKLSPLH